MSTARDVLALWLLYLIVLAAVGVAGLAVFWIGWRFGQGRAARRCWCASAETVVLPLQREASQ